MEHAVWWKGGVKMCGKVLEMGQKGVMCPHAPLTVKTGHSRSWYVYIYLYLQLNVTQQTSLCVESSPSVFGYLLPCEANHSQIVHRAQTRKTATFQVGL